MGMDAAALRQRVDALHEFNPMLGHRGCRLAISYPEIAEMQARAIFEAAVAAAQETGAAVVPEIMVPLVGLQLGAGLCQGAHRCRSPGMSWRRRACGSTIWSAR